MPPPSCTFVSFFLIHILQSNIYAAMLIEFIYLIKRAHFFANPAIYTRSLINYRIQKSLFIILHRYTLFRADTCTRSTAATFCFIGYLYHSLISPTSMQPLNTRLSPLLICSVFLLLLNNQCLFQHP